MAAEPTQLARVAPGSSQPTDARARRPGGAGRVLSGEWFYTTRPGAEGDLIEELELALGAGAGRRCASSCVLARGAPIDTGGAVDLAFARQGFLVSANISDAGNGLESGLVQALAELPCFARGPSRRWALSLWVPDATETLPFAARAAALELAVARRLAEVAPELAGRRRDVGEGLTGDAVLVQGAMIGADRVILGWVPVRQALSMAPAGRLRMRVGASRPSRSARKLEEALAWLGIAPGAGETCVDLGAAPGGWSWGLLRRRARVVAIDPGRLRADLTAHAHLQYHRMSAFDYEPSEPVDWLFCDMAWRPLEVAALLAKWGRRRWASLLVANLKLPMRRKAEMVVSLRRRIEEGGWRDVRARQLYHDRDEVTVTAHR